MYRYVLYVYIHEEMSMRFLSNAEREFCRAASELAYCNPFLPERIQWERAALGEDFVERGAVWDVGRGGEGEHPNILKIGDRAEALAKALRERLIAGARPAKADRLLYEDLVLYVLFHRSRDLFYEKILSAVDRKSASERVRFYEDFVRDVDQFFDVPGVRKPDRHVPPNLFACFFQIRRAFHFIYRQIVGASMPAARLRAAVWRSVFTHDMRRYRRALYDRMGDIATLVTGPSGTGKELVARAIGLSRYIPFDPKTQAFAEKDFAGSFYPLNLSALSPTLIESELFGHRRGSFTGAVADRVGWLEVCPPLGTVFLDEIGEVASAIQVKLLRVLEIRTFQRIGDTEEKTFRGKIIAATNRDPAREMCEGRLREDFYYRLCSDIIVTPSLREQLSDSLEGLKPLIRFIARRIVGEDEFQTLADEVEEWIGKKLGRDYAWPGNVRELEQCVRNILIRREYHPAPAQAAGAREALAQALDAGTLTADELLQRYCTLVYARTGNLSETARWLRLDRRTVQKKIDRNLLEEFKTA